MGTILGQRVRDTVTGLVGIVISRQEHLNSSPTVSIQPPCDEDNRIPGSWQQEESLVEVVDNGVAEVIENGVVAYDEVMKKFYRSGSGSE